MNTKRNKQLPPVTLFGFALHFAALGFGLGLGLGLAIAGLLVPAAALGVMSIVLAQRSVQLVVSPKRSERL